MTMEKPTDPRIDFIISELGPKIGKKWRTLCHFRHFLRYLRKNGETAKSSACFPREIFSQKKSADFFAHFFRTRKVQTQNFSKFKGPTLVENANSPSGKIRR